MSRVVKRSAIEATGRQRARGSRSRFRVGSQLCQPVETAPSGPQWLHEIKLDGFPMSPRASIVNRRANGTPDRRAKGALTHF